MERKYPWLYNLSPRLYEFGDQVEKTITNTAFVMKNRGYRKRINADPSIRKEYEEALRALKGLTAQKAQSLRYPANFAMSYESGLVLYSIIRRLKPDLILETGVANGFSTRLILGALNASNNGKLVSVEISDDVGQLLEGIDKARWSLKVGKPKENLKDAISSMGRIDMFVHDSDHSYENMKFEFESVIGKMSPDGVLASDDVNCNNAFLEFAQKINKRPILYSSFRKTFGVIALGSKGF